MLLYHGSDHIIERPVYHGGKRHNDYGYGFYCTQYEDMGREWSVAPERCGYLNSYDFTMEGMKLLNLNEYPVLTWLAVLLENRTFQFNSPLAREADSYIRTEFGIDYEEYDVIVGYRADDSYFSFAQDFINGTISVRQLVWAMSLGKLGDQVVLKSKEAYEHIVFLGAKEVDSLIWYPKREERCSKARQEYYSMDKEGYIRGDIYVTRLIDEEIKKDDVRIQ